jgi:hypothetical protein
MTAAPLGDGGFHADLADEILNDGMGDLLPFELPKHTTNGTGSAHNTDSSNGVTGIVAAFPDGWRTDKKGNQTKTALDAGAVATVLEPGKGDFPSPAPGLTRFNDLTRRIEFNGQPVEEDRAEVIHVDLQQKGYSIGARSAIDGILKVAYDNRYHPVREYLEHLAGASIEPVDLSTLASTYLGTSDPLYDAMLRKTLIGAVARVFEPGCQFDSVCVLRGKQGIRKSSFWKTIASPAWFNCTAPDGQKDLLLNVHACWFFELAELETVTSKREVGHVRNLITTTTDLLRVPYGKATAPRDRSSIFCATVNGETFLRDDEGSRRWWVIECPQDFDRGGLIDLDLLLRDRDAIWKAAVLAYRNGERPFLDHADQVASNRRNSTYEQEHPWQAPLDAWVQSHGPTPFTTTEALLGAGCCKEGQIGRKEEMDGAAVLKKLGLTRQANPTSGAGGRSRRWTLTQPAQPDTTSSPEVVSPQTADGDSDLSTLTQPAQPLSSKRQEVDKEGHGREEKQPIELFPHEVVPEPKHLQKPCAAVGLPGTTSPGKGCVTRPPDRVIEPLRALRQADQKALPAQLANRLGTHGIHADGRQVKDWLTWMEANPF